MKLDTHELAWAAGFFDGEGCSFLGISKYKKKDGTISVHRPANVAIAQVERGVLERFQKAVGGLGTVAGPYNHRKMPPHGNERPCYQYRITGFEFVQAVLAMLWKFLSEPKRRQATFVLKNATYKAQQYRGTPPCTVNGCGKSHLAKGYCKTHYREYRRSLGLPI